MLISDKRTFQNSYSVKINVFNAENAIHLRLSELSKQAHALFDDEIKVESIRNEIDELYIQSLM